MKECKHNSLEYKIKRCVIIMSTLFQIIHYIYLYLDTRQIEFIFLIIATAGYSLSASTLNFSNGAKNNLVVMILALIASYVYLGEQIVVKIAFVIIISEIVILFLGVLCIYRHHYGKYLFKEKRK